MASLAEVLGPIFFTEMLVILGLMVLNTFLLTRRPIVLHLREIYFVNSPSFKRAWYMVIAAMVFFLGARAVVEAAKVGAIKDAFPSEEVFLILFASLILGAFIEMVLVFQRYLPTVAASDEDIERRIRAHMRRNVVLQDDSDGYQVDLSQGGDLFRGRPTLGPYVSLSHYRGVVLGMTQYLEHRFGQLGEAILSAVGRQSGHAVALDMRKETPDEDEVLSGFLHELRLANVGLGAVVQKGNGRTNIRVEECAACSGMTPKGHAQCHYLTGLFNGLFQALGKKDVETREVKCWVKGDTFCEFQVDYES